MKKLTLLSTITFVLCSSLFSVSQETNKNNQLKQFTEHITQGSFLLDENIESSGIINEQLVPKVASNGSVFLAAWTDFRGQSSQNPDIYASRIDEDGNTLDFGGIPVCTADFQQAIADVVFDGVNFIVIWVDRRNNFQYDIYFARVTPSGEVLDPDGIQAASAINMVSYINPAAASGNNMTVVMWCEDMAKGGHAVKCMRIDQNANVLDPEGIIVSDTINDDTGDMAAAFDGTNFLIVWESTMYSIYDDILGSRLTTDGFVLDQGGFTIANKPGDQWVPDVSFGNGKYLVVWGDDSEDDDGDVFGTIVLPDGTVANTSGFPIANQSEAQQFPAIDFDGTNFIVSFTDRRNGWDTYATCVSPDGTVINPEGYGVGAWENTNARYGDISCGTNYTLAVWENKKYPLEVDVQGGRLSIPDYNMPDNEGFNISIGAYAHANPTSAFDGTNYLVVWEDWRTGQIEIWGTRVNTSGTILDPDGIRIGYNDTLKFWNPSVAFNGAEFMVTWNSSTSEGFSAGGRLSRVTSDGEVLDDPCIIIYDESDFCWQFNICSDGEQSLIVWHEYTSNAYDVFGLLADQNATFGEIFTISSTNGDQDFPGITFNGTNYLVIWEDYRNGLHDIYGTLISTDGTVLNPDGIQLTNGQNSTSNPAVCSNGNNFMVSWQAGSTTRESIYGSIIANDGSIILNSQAYYFASTYEHAQKPSVAFDGNDYLLCWQFNTNAHPDQDIVGVVVGPDGNAGQEFTIDNSEGIQYAPKLCQGNNGQILATYTGFTQEINSQEVNTFRSYGNFIDQLTSTNPSMVMDTDIDIYPNPTYSTFKVCKPQFISIYKIEIIDLYGKAVMIEELTGKGNEQIIVDIAELKAGIYYVRIMTEDQMTVKKIIKL